MASESLGKYVESYKEDDFGSQQRTSFAKDLAKLTKAVADYKYLFLTAPRAFESCAENTDSSLSARPSS
jgi:ABC-type hemin transport system ATPase subunit